MQLEFDGLIEIHGVNPYVLVTAEQAAVLKARWRRPMPVLVQVNGQPLEPWHINLMPMGNGDFYLYLHEIVRRASGTGAGDTVRVTLAFDSDYVNGPQHPVPPAFAAALETDSTARRNWDGLPPSRQKEVLRMFAGLKSDEARRRNVEKALIALSGAPTHFMGRDWGTVSHKKVDSASNE